jgi:hypothetical protein
MRMASMARMATMARIATMATAAAAAALAAGAGCKPDLGAPISLVSGPRILAVRGTPPEAKEGAVVSFDLLAVDAGGTVASPAAAWALCREPRPPSETNAVSGACLAIPDDAAMTPTFQTAITAADPNDPKTSGACSIFGPLRPPTDPTARPRDPDVTGGFYQPVRVSLPRDDGGPALLAFQLQRIQCRLGNAPQSVSNELTNTYTPNVNPSLAALTLTADGGAPVALAPVPPGGGGGGAPPPTVAAGGRVTFEASWAGETAETFPVYDLQTIALVSHREALRVSWFATDGLFEHDVTGRGEDDPELSTVNGWTAPAAGGGTVHLWLVLRDSRGGLDFAEFALDIAP